MEEVKDYAYPMLMAQKCLKLAHAELLKKNQSSALEMLVVTQQWLADAQLAIIQKDG